MTRDEFLAAARQCEFFLCDHYRKGARERMQEIADSEYCELRPDGYGQGGFVAEFEKEIAELLGKEAAVVMPSGTMAQQIALRIWADRDGCRRVAFHPTCHLEKHEHMAYRELHGLEAVLVGEPDRLFTLEDLEGIDRQLSSLLIELPQREIGGQLPSWDELNAITDHAKQRGIRLHVDGARLWERQPYFDRPYKEIVAAFDSVYVSFYKILGGLPGAALAGPADFTDEARIWQRRHGGNLVHMFPTAISAKIGIDKYLPRIKSYVAKAAEVAEVAGRLPGVEVVPKNPPTNMMHLYFQASPEQLMEALGEIALREKCLLLSYSQKTDRGTKAELWIGDAALDLPREKIEELFNELVATLA